MGGDNPVGARLLVPGCAASGLKFLRQPFSALNRKTSPVESRRYKALRGRTLAREGCALSRIQNCQASSKERGLPRRPFRRFWHRRKRQVLCGDEQPCCICHAWSPTSHREWSTRLKIGLVLCGSSWVWQAWRLLSFCGDWGTNCLFMSLRRQIFTRFRGQSCSRKMSAPISLPFLLTPADPQRPSMEHGESSQAHFSSSCSLSPLLLNTTQDYGSGRTAGQGDGSALQV